MIKQPRANGRFAQSPLRERLLSRLIIDPSGCLLWTGYTDQDGYGLIKSHGRRFRVHRLMYQWFVGPIPDDMELDHLCRVRHCASPAHLEAVTSDENRRRGFSPFMVNARKDRCDSGHEFDLFNTYIDRRGKRCCRKCWHMAQRRWRARKAGEAS